MATLNIGIIGAGGIANAHSAAAKAYPGDLSIVAVADPNPASRQKLADEWNASPCGSAEELILKAEHLAMRAVVVCTPPSARLPIVKAALAAGLHVLSEKPLAHTVSDARKLAALAKKSRKLVAATAYCHRFTPAVLEMKRLVASGKIGRLVRFENAFACDLPGHKDKWFSDPTSAGGGAFIDMGSHSGDLFHFMVGPAKVLGAVNDFAWPGRTETAATLLVRSTKAGGPNIPAGVAGVIISGWAESSRFTVTLVGTGGSLFYDYEKPTELVYKDPAGKAEIMPIEEHGVRFARQLKAFADAVNGVKGTGLATFDDGLAAAMLVDAEAKAGGRAKAAKTTAKPAARSAPKRTLAKTR